MLPCLEQGAFYVDLERTVSAIQEDEVAAHLQGRFGTHGECPESLMGRASDMSSVLSPDRQGSVTC